MLGLLSGALVARVLGVEDRGVLAALLLWPALIANIGDLGGPTAITYLASRRSFGVARLQGTALAVALVQSAALAAVGVPVLALGLSRYSEHLSVAIVFLVVYLPLNLVSRYANALNQGTGSFAQFNAVRITVQAAYVIGIASLYATERISINTVLLVALASSSAALVVALVGRARQARTLLFDRKVARSLVRYGPRAQLGVLTPVDSLQLDLAAVVLLSSASEAGYYAIAIAAALIVRAHGTSFGMVALASVGAENQASDQHREAARMIRLAVLANFITAAAILLAAPFLVPAVYGGAFSPAIPAAQILVVGMFAASVRQVLGDCLRGLGRPARASWAELFSLLVALPLLALLVPPYGAVGAAAAAAAAYFAALATSAFFLHRTGIPLSRMFIVRRADLYRLRNLFRPTTLARNG